MNRLIISLFLLIGIKGYAQFGNDFLHYSMNKRGASLSSEFDLNSDFISNKFITRFYNGNYIDKPLKDEQLNRLTGMNTAGGWLNNQVIVFLGKDSSKYRMVAGINQKQFFNSSISSDFYKLLFYGNKQFIGDYANLGNSQINNYSFQELKLGFLIDGVDTTNAIMGISVSYLRGHQFFRLKTNNSSLFTAPDISSIHLSTNAQFSISDTSSKKWFETNGIGLSSEFFVETPYLSKLGKSKFIISVANLGFIKWNSNTLNYITDSTFIFKGVKIDDIFNLNDSTLNGISLDSINENSTNLDRSKNATNLPVSFLVYHKIRVNSFFEFCNGFRHLFNANYKPYLFAEAIFTFKNNFILGSHIGFGGYGKLNGGINITATSKKGFKLRIGTNSLQFLIMPQRSLGMGGFISFSYNY